MNLKARAVAAMPVDYRMYEVRQYILYLNLIEERSQTLLDWANRVATMREDLSIDLVKLCRGDLVAENSRGSAQPQCQDELHTLWHALCQPDRTPQTDRLLSW